MQTTTQHFWPNIFPSLRGILILLVFWGAFLLNAPNAVAAVSVVKPNGGEVLCTNQAYTVEVSYTTAHVAIYYKTDGTQPAPADGANNIDPSVISHPENGTTYNWTPNSSHISETGRIWVEGHLSNHNSAGQWDQSNANFTVKACASSAGDSSSYIPPTQTGATNPISYLAYPVPLEAVASATSSMRYNFQLQGLGLGSVELLTWKQTQVEQFSPFVLAVTSVASLAPLQVWHIAESGLAANTRYENRFLRGIAGVSVTVPSRIFEPVYTAIETPQLSATGVTATQIVLSVGALSNVGMGLSGVFFTNLTTGISSGWTQSVSWTFPRLDPDATYQFLARARNGDGQETPWADLFTVKTRGLIPVAPTSPTSAGPIVPISSSGLFPDGALLRASGDMDIWFIEGGTRRHIPNPEAFAALGYRWEDVQVVSMERLLLLQALRLVKTKDSPAVWYIGGGRRRWVPSPAVFELYQWRWDRVREVSGDVLQSYAPVRLLRAFDDFRVWLVEPGGKRRWVNSLSAFQKAGFLWDAVVLVLPEEVAAYPQGPPLP